MSILKINEDNFKESIENGKVLVYFYDNSKKSCQIYNEIMQQLEKNLEGEVIICKVNIKDCEKLKVKLGVMSLPSTFYFKSSKLSQKFVGIRTVSDFENILK